MRGIRHESWGKFISSWEATDPSTAIKWLLYEKVALLHTPEGGPGRIFWFRVLSWVWVWSHVYGPPSVSYFFPTSILANPHSQPLGLGLTQICWLLPSCLQSFLINHACSQLNKYPRLSVPVLCLVYGLPSCQEKRAYPRHNDHWGSNVLSSWWPSRIVMLLQTWVVLVLFPDPPEWRLSLPPSEMGGKKFQFSLWEFISWGHLGYGLDREQRAQSNCKIWEEFDEDGLCKVWAQY